MTLSDQSAANAVTPGKPPGGAIAILDTADGSRLRYGAWPAAKGESGGTVLLLHGRTEFIEKHFETIADLRARGLGVFTLDWRGQGLSDGPNGDPQKGHIGDYTEYLDDLDLFVRTIVVPETTGPVFILAHSMGALVALQYCHDHPGMIERLVLCSPLIQLAAGRLPGGVTQLFARLGARLGFHNNYVPGRAKYWAAKENFADNPLTTDPGRYQIAAEWIDRDSNLAVGPPTIGWLGAMFRSISIIHRLGYADAIKEPVLMVAAGRDDVVSGVAARQYCDLLPQGKFLILPDARHEILHERDEIRAVFWEAFDRFLGLGDG